jgi:hypothetical protein
MQDGDFTELNNENINNYNWNLTDQPFHNYVDFSNNYTHDLLLDTYKDKEKNSTLSENSQIVGFI